MAQQAAPPRLVRTADNDMAHAMGATEIDQRFDRVFRAQAHDLGAQVPRPLFIIVKIALQGGVDPVIRFAFGFHVHDKPIGIQSPGQTRALSQQLRAMRRWSRRQTNHHPFARGRSALGIVVAAFG